MLTAISDTRLEAEPEDGEALDPSETALDAGLLGELEPAVGAGGGDGGQSLPNHGHAQTVFGVGDGDQGVAGGNSLGAMGALSGTLPDLALPIDDEVLRTGGDTSGPTAFAAAPAASAASSVEGGSALSSAPGPSDPPEPAMAPAAPEGAAGGAVVKDSNASHTLDFSDTDMSAIAEVNAAGGNDTVIASNLGTAPIAVAAATTA
jgi:hypothetical protein